MHCFLKVFRKSGLSERSLQPAIYYIAVGSIQPSNAVRSVSTRKRKSAARAAAVSQWRKKPKVVGARVMDIQCLSNGIQRTTQHSAQCKSKCSVKSFKYIHAVYHTQNICLD